MPLRLATALLSVLLLAAGDPPTPATTPPKWEGPWVGGPFGRLKTTIYYGPWQCNRAFMSECERQCAQKQLRLKGCMWLADFKFDGEGLIPFMGTQVKTGTRFAITHCCCNYPELKSAADPRQQWVNVRKSFRQDWGKRFGEWPKDDKGEHWPGHHVHDLAHGGAPTDEANIIPTQPAVHKIFNDEYPICYSGSGRWSTVGPDLPYKD